MNAQLSAALMPITTRPEAIMIRGEGSYLWDNHGSRYLDFIQGWAVNCLGHCPEAIVEALHTQARTLISPSPALHNAPQHALAQRLSALSGLAEVHFANSGAEANEVAVKLARKWGRLNKPEATQIITTLNGFHGRTLAMMAASGKPGWDELFAPAMPGFRKVPFGDTEAMREAIGAETIAVMLEPIQGEAGVIVPPADYLRAVRTLTEQTNTLLIFDEVQTGVGRTGSLFAFEQHKITPDIMTLGKGLGGGIPISAMLAAPAVCCFEPGDQGGTYNGNPLMTAAALRVVEEVAKPQFLHAVCARGEQLREGIESLSTRYALSNVRGAGLLLGVDLPKACAPDVVEAAFELGFLINAPRPNSLRLMPALNVGEAQIREAIALLDQALSQTL